MFNNFSWNGDFFVYVYARINFMHLTCIIKWCAKISNKLANENLFTNLNHGEKNLSEKYCNRVSCTESQTFLRLHPIAHYFPKCMYICDIISIHAQVKRLCAIHLSMLHEVSPWNWYEWNSSPKSPTWFENIVFCKTKTWKQNKTKKTWWCNTPWKNSQRSKT